MARLRYEPERIAAFYDAWGPREWDRFDTDAGGRASLRIHTGFIDEFIEPGWRVLDIGPEAAIEEVVRTGELSEQVGRGHRLRLFRWRERSELLAAHGCALLSASAANVLSAGHDALLADCADTPIGAALLDWEARLAREPGALDVGTHILAAARAP